MIEKFKLDSWISLKIDEKVVLVAIFNSVTVSILNNLKVIYLNVCTSVFTLNTRSFDKLDNHDINEDFFGALQYLTWK